MDYTGWSEEDLLARQKELEDEIADIETAMTLEYLVDEGFVSVEKAEDGDWRLYLESDCVNIPTPSLA